MRTSSSDRRHGLDAEHVGVRRHVRAEAKAPALGADALATSKACSASVVRVRYFSAGGSESACFGSRRAGDK